MSGDGRDRAIAWRHRVHASVAARVEPWAHGTVVRAPDVPEFYDYNAARVEGGDPGLDAAALAAAAEAGLAGLAHRRIEIEDEAAGERLRRDFESMGWVTERLVYLHRALPAEEVRPPAGVELRMEPFERSRALRLAWQGESIWGDPPEFMRIEEAVARRRGTRAVVAHAQGEPAGFAAFTRDGEAMEIDQLFVLPGRRGGGMGAALVTCALAAGHGEGAAEALIEADDEGDARRLYERLGFRPVWRRHIFTRRPDRG